MPRTAALDRQFFQISVQRIQNTLLIVLEFHRLDSNTILVVDFAQSVNNT